MDIEVIEVEVDDQAQTSALGALSDAAAANALRLETKRAPSPRIGAPPAPRPGSSAKSVPPPAPKLKADGTQEIELGDVLEVMQKMSPAKATPSVELAADPIVTPAPAARIETPAVVLAAPVNPNATMEIRPGDVLEEMLVDMPADAVAAPQLASPTVPMVQAAPVPAPENSDSDLLKTTLRPPTPTQNASASASLPLPQFNPDEEVAPFASDTVDIPLDRVQGLPIWLQIKGKPGVAVVGGAIGGCVLIGALAIGMHFHNASSEEAARTATTTTTTTAVAAAAAPMNHDDPSAAIPPPPDAPDVPSVSIDDLQKAGRASTMAAAAAPVMHPAHHAHPSAHHDAAVAPAPATHARAGAKPQGFGTLRTWIAARGEPIAVDGKVVGTAPSPVRVACGDHTVAIGKEIVHANIPCDGSVTVGSPDHKK